MMSSSIMGRTGEEVRSKPMGDVFSGTLRTIFQAIWVHEFIKFLDELVGVLQVFARRHIHIFDLGDLGLPGSVDCSATGQ